MGDKIAMGVVAIIYIAILFVLVRPKSKGPTIVQNLANALSDLVRGVTGQTYDASTGKWSLNG